MKQLFLWFPAGRMLIALGFSLCPASAEDASVSHPRLVRVCANLKNASALATSGSATSVAEGGRHISPLFRCGTAPEILKAADALSTGLPSTPKGSHPDIFGYTKDAHLAMIDNRKEVFSRHRRFVKDR